uniref:transferrin receptor protein 2-like isoform X1 n=1 Tax=Scatophagus argus TaxID=75038 RepID=UPI001ED82E46|nr:transferrin receptor protein 2-like isoform X1 [Scatophagus argus]
MVTLLSLQAPSVGEEKEQVGGAQRLELRLVTSEAEEEAELSSDITALMQQYHHGYRKACVFLCVCGVVVFTTAFLLAYAVFGGRCHGSQVEGQEEDEQQPPAGGGAGLYLGDLRVMMRRLLQDEDIHNTVSRVSRASHPPGSAEGMALASEVLQRFRQLQMDHTWTESLYATLQFPHRSQKSSLWLVDSAGLISEQIPLNPSDFCPYSATGSTTGGVVFANYGRPQDFNWLRSAGVSVVGCVVVMRVGGGVSFAEKVGLAERNGAGGALIYPDPADLPQDPQRLGLNTHTAVSEHVHLGSGDPFTPGFPSFNHTQFPSIQSSGLPLIPVLPVSASVATKLLSQLSGPPCPSSWRSRLPYVCCVVGPDFSSGRRVKMAVNNVMTPVLLNNIFSSLEGRIEPDQYIILGAQRDSLGPGAVKSGVGTAILLELARTFSAMVKSGKTHLKTGFSPRRSLLFVSWDAGDFGNVGATEWLEGYLSMLHLKAVAYFSLDQAVMGDDVLSAYSSPLLVDLLDAAIRQVEHPKHAGQTIHSQAEREGGSWRIMKPLYLNSGAYTFTAFAGVPAVELRFTEERPYPFVNTPMDSTSRLQEVLGGRLGITGRSLGQLVGEMVLRLAHDHILPLRITSYAKTVLQFSAQLIKHSAELQWVFSARGDYSRAAEMLQRAIDYSDLQEPTTARFYNTRIMRVQILQTWLLMIRRNN